MKERNRQMALLTFFTMLLVIIGHSDITDDFRNLWIYKWVYSFHMPMFFFISGFLFCLTNPSERLETTSYGRFMQKKAVRLLVPFFFINTLIFIIKALFITDTSMMKHPVEMTLSSFLYRTFIHPIGFMWFLPAMFLVFAMAFPLCKRLVAYNSIGNGGRKRLTISIIAIIIAAAALHDVMPHLSFFCVSNALYYLPYFLLGILYCIYKEPVNGFIRRFWWVVIPLFGALSLSLVLHGRLAALAGIAACTPCGLLLAEYVGSRMMRISQYTYTIFLLAYFPQMFVRGPVAHHLLPDADQYLLSVLSFVSGLTLPLIFCEIFTRIRGNSRTMTLLGKLVGL